jgi:hypothetical protein
MIIHCNDVCQIDREAAEAASFGKQGAIFNQRCRPVDVPERPLNGGDNSVRA